MTIDIVEVITDEFAEIELRSELPERPRAYDDDGDRPTLSVLIRRAETSAVAFSVQELLEAIQAVGLDVRVFAKEAPEVLARAVGYLEDQGRVIRNHHLFADLINEQGNRLPRVEDEYLVWNTVAVERGNPMVEERRLRVT